MTDSRNIVGEFWTSKQRTHNSLHEISYRDCFKPALVEYFVDKYTKQGDTVLDPFAGHGTTAIQAALMGRNCISYDINPLSYYLTLPRLHPPKLDEVTERLERIYTKNLSSHNYPLSMFYHPDTYNEIRYLK